MSVSSGRAALAAVGVSYVFAITGAAQPGHVYTTADYAQAEKFMDYIVNELVLHSVDHPAWLADRRFWFIDTGTDGVTYTLVDPAKGTKAPAFDQVKLAAALNAALANTPAKGGRSGPEKFDANHLAITELSFEDGDKTILVTVSGRQLRCDLSGLGSCVSAGDGRDRRGSNASALSPDGKIAAFIREDNLWVRDTASGQETQLTTDGVKNYGYATDNTGWARSDRPVLVWSPNSKEIATFQQDQRNVKEMYLIPTVVGHPELNAVKYPLAGDAAVALVKRVIIDVDSKKVVRLKIAADYHRSTTCDNISCRGGWDDTQWSGDSKHLAFVSTSRDHKQEWLRVADAETGVVREVFSETVRSFIESGIGKADWKYLSASNEILWFSERDNWGQLYLYDLTTGNLKNQITHGDGNVTQVLYVDENARVIFFLGVGKESGRDPYFSAFYRVNFDGSGQKLLTPEDSDHSVKVSKDGRYFSDVYSTATTPTKAVIRDNNGKVVVQLPSQDISKLKTIGWIPPVPITVKARDGKTDLYGFLFKPTSFDAANKYPIVNNIYPGSQTGSCGKRNFAAAHKDLQSLAELGFIVVCIDGTGTPLRSKSFHEALFGDMGDNTIPDQVAGMKELAARYPWIDIDRMGIYGHSGGGAATAAAMFHYPDFFKVGISESGNHDNREYEDDWGEKWLGLEVKDSNGKSNYDSQANQDFAKNLKGHGARYAGQQRAAE